MWGGFTLIVGRYLDFWDVLGWVGGAEMWELRIRCSNWGWMCKKQNMLKNWTGEGGSGRGKIGICDAFLMHFRIFRNKLFRIIFRMVFLMHFGFLLTGLKKE